MLYVATRKANSNPRCVGTIVRDINYSIKNGMCDWDPSKSKLLLFMLMCITFGECILNVYTN